MEVLTGGKALWKAPLPIVEGSRKQASVVQRRQSWDFGSLQENKKFKVGDKFRLCQWVLAAQ